MVKTSFSPRWQGIAAHAGSSSFTCGLLVHVLAAACVGLGGCAGPELLNEVQLVDSLMPVASGQDERILATIENVIVRNGTDAWALDAEWDEYLIRIGVRSDEPVEIQEVALFDALNYRIESGRDREELAHESREIERRYVLSGMLLRARGGNGWVAAKAESIGVAELPAYEFPPALINSVIIVGAVVAMVDITGISRVFVQAGVNRMVNNAKVNAEIRRRQTALPVALKPGAETSLDVFFPVTPLSGRTQIMYADRHGEHYLDIDTRQALMELRPTPTVLTAPEFPDHARRAGAIRGYVSARLTLDREGRVQHVEVIDSIPWRLFDEDALRIFREWTYTKSRFDRRIVEARLEFKR